MKRELTLAVCGFVLLVIMECPGLLAQAELAKPALNASDPFMQTCDSLNNPAPGESQADAVNRHKAWWHCLESGEGAGARLFEGMSPPVNVHNVRLVAGAGSSFADRQSLPVTQPDADVHNASPTKEPFIFTVGSGPWSKVISVNQVLRGSHQFLVTLGLARKTRQPPIK
jgi:hypothetical protein